MRKCLKRGNIYNTSLTPDEDVNILIEGLTAVPYTNFKNQSGFWHTLYKYTNNAINSKGLLILLLYDALML